MRVVVLVALLANLSAADDLKQLSRELERDHSQLAFNIPVARRCRSLRRERQGPCACRALVLHAAVARFKDHSVNIGSEVLRRGWSSSAVRALAL